MEGDQQPQEDKAASFSTSSGSNDGNDGGDGNGGSGGDNAAGGGEDRGTKRKKQVEESPGLKAAVDYFTSRQLRFDVSARKGRIVFGLDSDKIIIFTVQDLGDLMHCQVIARTFNPPPESWPRLYEYCAWVNRNIMIGNLELNEGKLVFRTAVMFKGMEQFGTLVGPMYHLTVNTFDRYLPGAIALVSDPELPCKEALKKRGDDVISRLFGMLTSSRAKSESSDEAEEPAKKKAKIEVIKEGEEEGEGGDKKSKEKEQDKEEKGKEKEKKEKKETKEEVKYYPHPPSLVSDPMEILVDCHIPSDELTIEKRIHKGGFAKIYQGNYNGTEVVIKEIVQEMPRDVKETFIRKILATRQLVHPNVVQVLGMQEAKKGCKIILELMGKGSLWDILQEEGTATQWKTKLNWLIDVARGMCFLHSKGVVHGDLKTRNILINSYNVAKVADVGLSTLKHASALIYPGTYAFSPAYAAPEIFEGRTSTQSDVFSFSIVMWETLTASTPYLGTQIGELPNAIKSGVRPAIPEYLSEEKQALVSLLKRCWDADPSARPRFKDILNELLSAASSLS